MIMIGVLLSGSVFLASGQCSDEYVAILTAYSGKVLIKIRGTWGVRPRRGLRLYSDDKVVTRIGNATIEFRDGTVVRLYNNSNVLIREQKKGLLKKAALVERHILLFLGKLFFKTGREKVDLRFETATALVGIRGTSGILSIGADGMTYIKFIEGHAAYTIGRFVKGIAEEVPVEIADKNSVQRASFVARAAADQLRRTIKKVEKGEMPPQQVALARAIRDEAAALEMLENGKLLLRSPDPKVVQWAKERIEEAKQAIEKAKEAQQKAIREGADPFFKGFGPGEPGFDIPPEPSPLSGEHAKAT